MGTKRVIRAALPWLGAAFLALVAWASLLGPSAWGIDTSEVNLAVSGGTADGTVTITRVGDTLYLTDGVTGAKTLAQLVAGGGGAGTWGSITGTLANQSDLAAALGAKAAGPGSATANAVALFDGTGGKLLKSTATLVYDPSLGSLRLGSSLNSVLGIYSVAGGYSVLTTGTASLAYGNRLRVGGDRSAALGYWLSVYGDDSFAAGRQIRLNGEPEWALGRAIVGTASNTMGFNVTATTLTMTQGNTIYLRGTINTGQAPTHAAVPYVTSAGNVVYVADTGTSGTALVVGSDGLPYWGRRGGGSVSFPVLGVRYVPAIAADGTLEFDDFGTSGTVWTSGPTGTSFPHWQKPAAAGSGGGGTITDKVDLTGQGANIEGTSIPNTTAAGVYVIHWTMVCTTDDGAAGSVAPVFTWTGDGSAYCAKNFNDTANYLPPLSLAGAIGWSRDGVLTAYKTGSSPIGYSVTMDSGSYGSARFSLHIRVVKME